MRIFNGLLVLCLAAASSLPAQTSDPAKVADYLKTLPNIAPPPLDETRLETLAAASIGCVDRPEEAPSNKNSYLWLYPKAPQILDGYDKNRAFYGCSDWHSAVGSTWMLVSLLRQDPKITLGSDVKDLTTNHFKKSNMDGEFAYFNDLKGPAANFEKPYGYAWLLKLTGEAKSWNTPDGKKLAAALTPLAKWMSERYVFYLYNLKFPFRTGTETNTAWSMSLALDYANLTDDTTLKTAIHANTIRLFEKDKNCPTELEPASGDLLSACLTEAALVGRVMDQQAYLKWLDAYLPPVYSEPFQIYARDVDVSHVNPNGPDRHVQLTVKARQIGLNFQRATDLLTIAYALPANDARIAVLKNLAAASAKHGYDKIGTAGYEGQHWLSTFAFLYENENKGPAPLAPEKPKTRSGDAAEPAEAN
jgi:hypothetical protein